MKEGVRRREWKKRARGRRVSDAGFLALIPLYDEGWAEARRNPQGFGWRGEGTRWKTFAVD
jgi:hypothetical protein